MPSVAQWFGLSAIRVAHPASIKLAQIGAARPDSMPELRDGEQRSILIFHTSRCLNNPMRELAHARPSSLWISNFEKYLSRRSRLRMYVGFEESTKIMALTRSRSTFSWFGYSLPICATLVSG